jgi:hypothetical protein
MYKRVVKSSLLVFGLIGFSGCALKQAPLMYSSKTVFGADIGTAVAESGVTINIGFKNHDMVYIPAMVSNDINCSNNDKNVSLERVVSRDENNATDTLSVFATFGDTLSTGETNKTSVGKVGFGLNKFLATGIAAQNLSENYSEHSSKKIAFEQCMNFIKDINKTQDATFLKECTSIFKN